jgi:hypothetical protein
MQINNLPLVGETAAPTNASLTRFFGKKNDTNGSTSAPAQSVMIQPPPGPKKNDTNAAIAFSKRPNNNPKIMYSDTWPNGQLFWTMVFPLAVGMLGLWHWMNRIFKTMRSRHFQFGDALRDLQMAAYDYVSEDLDLLYSKLKDGSLNGKTHSEAEIVELMKTKTWTRYSKTYLRKVMHPPSVIKTNLTAWHAKYKYEASDGRPAAGGMLDPRSGKTLFTSTKH